MQATDLVCYDILKRLIAYDTTSRNSNLPLIHWVKDYLAGFGVESELTYDDDGGKANLFATLGPADRSGGIILSGHTDVVPVDGQDWVTEPFDMLEKDGRLYGRGTCDMKSFVAVSLAMVPKFLERQLTVPIHLAFSYDEEVGCIGVRRLIDGNLSKGIRPQACIVGEPTNMQPVIAHKGKRSFEVTIRGMEAHSSLAPKGVNAVEYAAEIIAHIKSMARTKAANGPFDTMFDIAHTTLHTGVINGGTALNIVPLHCRFEFEFRYIPADGPDALLAEVQAFIDTQCLPEMQAIDPSTSITIEEMSSIPGLDTDEDDEVVQLAKALSGANSVSKVAFGTEAGLFQQADVPTIVCGPAHIDQAHKPNEFVEISQVAQCEAFMGRLMDRVCAA
jgi:acetylornithine deacetylase